MNHEQKQRIFSRIRKSSPTSETADLPPDTTANTTTSEEITTRSPASAPIRRAETQNEEGSRTSAAGQTGADGIDPNDLQEADLHEYEENMGRGIFQIPANSLLFTLWDEWNDKLDEPQTEARLIMEEPDISYLIYRLHQLIRTDF